MDDIINLFTKEHGIYNEIFKFRVIIFFIIILVIFTKLKLTGKSVFVLISLIFSIYLSNLYIKVNKNDLNDNNKLIYFKLQSLQNKTYEYLQYKIKNNLSGQKIDTNFLYSKNKLDSLYIDSNIIVFLYSILKLYDYNPNEFYLLLKGTNNILKLRNEVEKYYDSNNNYPENISEMLQISMNLKINCMNNLQNFIYTVPKTNIMYKYIDSIIVEYTVLITKNIVLLNKYHKDFIKKNGINNKTVFVDINAIRGVDNISNYSVIPGKKQNTHKLIDLYI